MNTIETRELIVVIGSGPGGICTAIGVAQGGANVILLEKQSFTGGMLHIANGEISGAGTKRQRERGIDDDPTRHYEDVVRISHDRINRALTWMSVSRQGETLDWLDENDFDFDPTCPALAHGHEVYSTPRTYWGQDHAISILRILKKQLSLEVDAGRVEVWLNADVRELLTDDTGRVCGVRLSKDDKAEEELWASAVVLATGGYDANPKLRNEFLPENCASALVGCLNHATGDGLVMARKLGAAVSSDGIFLPVMGMIPNWSRPGHAVDYNDAYIELAPAYRMPREIWVNLEGKRFIQEDTPSPELRERALIQQSDVTFHVIYDQAAVEASTVPLIRNPKGTWDQKRFLEACKTSPWITRAATITELAEELAIEPDVLTKTVSEYNAAVDSGVDHDFGRTLLPARIEKGPFYAITSVATSLLSRDGLKVDTDLAVLDNEGRVIPGLYAVGEVLGNNVFAGDNFVGGMSITPAMTLGRLLGGKLAAGILARTK
jgi:fumarate reductase flavoprotein subunit